jgi:hypothetical protein
MLREADPTDIGLWCHSEHTSSAVHPLADCKTLGRRREPPPLPARDMPSSLGRNPEQNDTNRGNPPKAISIWMHDV